MNWSIAFRFVESIVVNVPFTSRLPSTVTPPPNVNVSLDWLPKVTFPPKSELSVLMTICVLYVTVPPSEVSVPPTVIPLLDNLGVT